MVASIVVTDSSECAALLRDVTDPNSRRRDARALESPQSSFTRRVTHITRWAYVSHPNGYPATAIAGSPASVAEKATPERWAGCISLGARRQARNISNHVCPIDTSIQTGPRRRRVAVTWSRRASSTEPGGSSLSASGARVVAPRAVAPQTRLSGQTGAATVHIWRSPAPGVPEGRASPPRSTRLLRGPIEETAQDHDLRAVHLGPRVVSTRDRGLSRAYMIC